MTVGVMAAHDIHDRCRGKEGGEFHTYLHTALIDICKTNEKFHFDTQKYFKYWTRRLAQTKLHNLADYQEIFFILIVTRLNEGNQLLTSFQVDYYQLAGNSIFRFNPLASKMYAPMLCWMIKSLSICSSLVYLLF